ncbi:MAG: hypothetical protein ACR2RV_01360 [Verrucomicrobiales bacterium]
MLKNDLCGKFDTTLHDEELSWMTQRRPLERPVTSANLTLDYGQTEAAAMMKGFALAKAEPCLGVLNWPGVATRWRRFLEWYEEQPAPPQSAAAAFAAFARTLGRMTTYRALALDSSALRKIFEACEIFPTGQLHTSAQHLSQIVEESGVRKIVVARLYIAYLGQMIGYDPSISLHDDWETTSCIASGYCGAQKPVNLFQLSVPVVESLGWRLLDVASMAPPFLGSRYAEHEPWFCFKSPSIPSGVRFDATLQRTERYGLYSVPFLPQRLRAMWKFGSTDSITKAIQPFAEAQEAAYRASPQGQGIPAPLGE